MNPTEADNQIVANIIAYGAFLVSVITLIYTVMSNRNSARIAKEANRTAAESLKISRHEYKVKLTPDLSGFIIFIRASDTDPKGDAMSLIVTNNSHSTTTIHAVESWGWFIVSDDLVRMPAKLLYRNNVSVRVELTDECRKHWSLDAQLALEKVGFMSRHFHF